MINDIIKANTFQELNLTKRGKIINFSRKAEDEKSELDNAVIVGTAMIGWSKVLCIQFDRTFKAGTIGVVEGEKLTLAFEFATQKNLPVIATVVSGGMRIQEGVLALMQMAKMVVAVKQHSDKGLLYIAIVTNPTLGGASASFVSLADIIIAEKDAIYGFTGKRIIEETTHELLPRDFQTAEYAKRHGMVDIIANRDEIKQIISKLLRLHKM